MYKLNGDKKEKFLRCCDTHKPLSIPYGDGTLKIHGSNCDDPNIKNADIYIGLDGGGVYYNRGMSYPWTKGHSFYYPIVNGRVPDNVDEFEKFIEWLSKKVISGKSVHVGCIGGHGRTGLVLASVYYYITKDINTIEKVRSGYCDKAVETKIQINFLHSLYGMNKSIHSYHTKKAKAKPKPKDKNTHKKLNKTPDLYDSTSGDNFDKGMIVDPLDTDFVLWGKNIIR